MKKWLCTYQFTNKRFSEKNVKVKIFSKGSKPNYWFDPLLSDVIQKTNPFKLESIFAITAKNSKPISFDLDGLNYPKVWKSATSSNFAIGFDKKLFDYLVYVSDLKLNIAKCFYKDYEIDGSIFILPQIEDYDLIADIKKLLADIEYLIGKGVVSSINIGYKKYSIEEINQIIIGLDILKSLSINITGSSYDISDIDWKSLSRITDHKYIVYITNVNKFIQSGFKIPFKYIKYKKYLLTNDPVDDFMLKLMFGNNVKTIINLKPT